jgi:GrpB-like predicted nucleotidyltransferase (UPF0157 family)
MTVGCWIWPRRRLPSRHCAGCRTDPHRPHALWFYKPASAGLDEHICHLHLTEPCSDLWRERLAFRDALRADPQLARQYQEIKRKPGRSAVGLSDYTAGKRSFVASVLANAGIDLPPAPGMSSHRRSS